LAFQIPAFIFDFFDTPLADAFFSPAFFQLIAFTGLSHADAAFATPLRHAAFEFHCFRRRHQMISLSAADSCRQRHAISCCAADIFAFFFFCQPSFSLRFFCAFCCFLPISYAAA